MPRYNIYIRKDDEAAWNAIEDKPGWLHQNLKLSAAQNRVDAGLDKLVDQGLEQLKSVPTAYNTCEHFQLRGQCLVKGCNA